MLVCLLVDSLRQLGHDATMMVGEPPPRWVPKGVDWTLTPEHPSRQLRHADAVVVGIWNVEEALSWGGPQVAHLIAGNEIALWPDKRELITSIYRQQTTKLVIADHLREELLADPGISATTIGTPIDLRAFQARGWRRPTAREVRILSVGADLNGPLAPLPFKGIAAQMEIIERARQDGDRFKFVRMSPRPDRHMSSELVDQQLIGFNLGRKPSRSFGWLEHRRNVARVYRSSDIYLSCSTKLEALGIPAIEAAAAGIPSVLPRIPSYAEIPELERCALFFEPGDLDEALRLLQTLIRDQGLRRRLGRAGERLGIERRFEPAEVARHLVAALDGATSPASSGPPADDAGLRRSSS